MSTAAVSHTAPSQQLQSYFQQRTIDLKQLGQALQSGDLAGAQQAFSTLQSLAQTGPLANSKAFAVTQRQQDFAAIGQALQSGDLAGAQQAFAQLQSTFYHSQRVLDPGPAVVVNITAPSASTGSASGASAGSSSSQSPSSAAPPPAAAAPPAAAPPELIINVGNSGGPEQITIGLNNTSAGEQLTISVAGQQGTNPEQIAINLGSNSGEQIVLNLFNATSTTPSPANGLNVTA
jgi:hypothetical protein